MFKKSWMGSNVFKTGQKQFGAKINKRNVEKSKFVENKIGFFKQEFVSKTRKNLCFTIQVYSRDRKCL